MIMFSHKKILMSTTYKDPQDIVISTSSVYIGDDTARHVANTKV
jgi:hypothetical protein